MAHRPQIGRNQILGTILCGGASRRFGSPKAFHKFGGISLVERAMHIVAPLVDEVTLAIGTSDASDWPKVRLFRDQFSGIGPLGGIHAALRHMTQEWLLVLAVDMPFLTTSALSKLVGEARDGDMAVVALDETGQMHPLCAMYHRSIRVSIEDAVNRNVYAPSRLLDRMDNIRYVTLPEEQVRNANRPEDLR